jgi:hypothetical protein
LVSTGTFSGWNVTPGKTPVFGQSSTSAFGNSTFGQVNLFEDSEVESREGSNRAATEAEEERLHSFIKRREADLTVLSRELSTEQNLLKACQLAISDHVDDIQKANSILKINKDNLASLTDIRSRLDQVKFSQNNIMNDESLIQETYSSLRVYLTIPLGPMLLQLGEQIDALGREIRTLWDKIRQLEAELVGWRTSKRLIEHTVKRIDANYSSIESDLRIARNPLRPIWRVPSEVWVKIFGDSIQEAKYRYLERQNNLGMRPPIFDLSQVCQSWRYLAHSTPELWTLAYVAPTNVWRYEEYELIVDSIKKSSVPLTILTSLHQPFPSGYAPNHRYAKNGSKAQTIIPKEVTLFNGREYTLIFDMQDDEESYMKRTHHFPISQPATLIYSARHSIQSGKIWSCLGSFSQVKSFSLLNDYPSSLPDTLLGILLPGLQEFTIHVKKFPLNFQLLNLLPATIQELHLRNDAGGPLPIMSANVELPQLRVLGITFPGSYLLDKLTAKALRSLTLYCSQDSTDVQPSFSQQAVEIYNQLLHLNFEDWRAPTVLESSLGAAPVLKNLIKKVPMLHKMKFKRCFVDGGALVPIVEAVLGSGGDTTHPTKLEEIILSYPSGITNDQCEELKRIVKAVKVYM